MTDGPMSHHRQRNLYGVIGESLSHSLSPAMFATILPQIVESGAYLTWESPPDELAKLVAKLKALGTGGFNVTIPHKVAILDHLDRVSPEVEALGAVNCVVAEGTKLVGHNTDAAAFRESLVAVKDRFERALVLGAGGAARAVVHVLRQLGVASITSAARRQDAVSADPFFQGCEWRPFREQEISTAASGCDLIVNATPVGMFPNAGICPLSTGFHSDQIAYDLIYRPRPTRFLQIAANAGARTIDGLEMLARQAAESLRLWTGAEVPYLEFLAAAEGALMNRGSVASDGPRLLTRTARKNGTKGGMKRKG